MPSPADNFATPRIAAGALFVKDDQVLLVRKTYGERWDIPGGYVDRGESPAQACRRELREELGLERKVGRLLVMDWAPRDDEGDKILLVFDCGPLGADEETIMLDKDELDAWAWVRVDVLGSHLNERLAPRLTRAYDAHRSGTMMNLEHGVSTTP